MCVCGGGGVACDGDVFVLRVWPVMVSVCLGGVACDCDCVVC